MTRFSDIHEADFPHATLLPGDRLAYLLPLTLGRGRINVTPLSDCLGVFESYDYESYAAAAAALDTWRDSGLSLPPLPGCTRFNINGQMVRFHLEAGEPRGQH